MHEDLIYSESVSSNRTEVLFGALTLVFLTLLIWRVKAARRLDSLAAFFLFLCALFLFYSLNYRTLKIRLTTSSLKLSFGIFSWTVPLNNIAASHLDHVPTFLRLGGAGIHFMTVRKRYRASFNFLQYPRIVIALKNTKGPVRDLSFSTRHPDHLLPLIEEAASESLAP